MPDAMRIVLAAMGTDEFQLLHETCAAAGHPPVAYVYARSMRPGEPAPTFAVDKVSELLPKLPGSVDLLLPAGPDGLRQSMVGYRPDLLVIYGFNWILRPEVFDLPRLGTVNIHPSLLPRYRGAAPIQWAIRNGDPEIGVTVHRVDSGVDTGPILAQRGGIPLAEEVTVEGLRSLLLPVVRELLTAALNRVIAGDPGEPQPAEVASRAPVLEPAFSRVDWSRPARDIHNQVRFWRYTGSEDKPVASVGDQWVRLVRTSLAPAEGRRVDCVDGPIWIVESEPVSQPPELA